MVVKKRKQKASKAAKRAAKPATKRKAASRKTAARKAAAGRPARRKGLHQVSARKRVQVFRDLDEVLAKHAVSGTISELHLTPDAAAPLRVGAAPMDAGMPDVGAPEGAGPDGKCPPGQIPKVVCKRNDQGEVNCVERCMLV